MPSAGFLYLLILRAVKEKFRCGRRPSCVTRGPLMRKAVHSIRNRPFGIAVQNGLASDLSGRSHSSLPVDFWAFDSVFLRVCCASISRSRETRLSECGPKPLGEKAHSDKTASQFAFGTSSRGMGRAENRYRHGLAIQRAQRTDRATRALSVAMPVFAYICR